MTEETPKPAHILLVEDEQNIALALSFLMERLGHKVTHLVNGREALHSVADICPDLVLLDVTLPDVSGYEICQHIRQTPALDQTMVLILTARGADIERRKALALGADGFMSKPFETAELKATVTHMLTTKREVS